MHSNPFEVIHNQLAELTKEVKDLRKAIPNANDPVPEWLSRKDVKALLQVSYTSIHRMQNEGFLPVYKVGNSSRYKRADVIKLFHKRSVKK